MVARYGALYAERSDINGTYERIAQFVVPNHGRFWQTMNDYELAVQWRHRYLYDSTAIHVSQNLAANIHGSLTNPSVRWFTLRYKQDWLNEDVEAMRWMETAQEALWYSIQESNFSLEANEFYLDLVTFGTAVMAHESSPEGDFKFKTYMVRGVYFEEDFDGKPTGIYRQKQYTAAQICRQFPENCPPDIMEQGLSATNAGTMHSVIHAIIKRPYAEEANINLPLPPDRRPVEERFILQKGAIELTQEPRGYYEFPAYVCRWAKQAGSRFGYSPAMNVLSDIMTLNQLVELILRSAEKVIDPPILVPDRGVFGDINLTPGGVTVCRDPKAMQPFESKARFDVSQLQREQLQKTIQDAFFWNQLQLKESPEMSATEVNARMSLMQRLLGPALSRLEADFLDPLVKRGFNILFRSEKLPPLPDVVMAAGGEVDVEYTGILARGQQMEEVQSIDRMMLTLQNLIPIVPQIADTINFDEVFRVMARNLSVPAQCIHSREEVEQIRQARAEQEQAQQEMMMAEQMAGAMKDAGSATKDFAQAGGVSGDIGL